MDEVKRFFKTPLNLILYRHISIKHISINKFLRFVRDEISFNWSQTAGKRLFWISSPCRRQWFIFNSFPYQFLQARVIPCKYALFGRNLIHNCNQSFKKKTIQVTCNKVSGMCTSKCRNNSLTENIQWQILQMTFARTKRKWHLSTWLGQRKCCGIFGSQLRRWLGFIKSWLNDYCLMP